MSSSAWMEAPVSVGAFTARPVGAEWLDRNVPCTQACPVLTNAGRYVTAIAAGQFYNLALMADGTVRAWGDNFGGQLGNATTTNSSTPVRVNQLAPCNALVGTSCFTTISAAYLAANSGDTIKALAIAFTESLTASRPVSVTIQGGYADANFGSIASIPSTITGLTISGGTLTLDRLAVN